MWRAADFFAAGGGAGMTMLTEGICHLLRVGDQLSVARGEQIPPFGRNDKSDRRKKWELDRFCDKFLKE